MSYVALDLGYEYLLDNKSSLGISLLYVHRSDDMLNYLITPYYRYYLGKKYASGFFIEGFSMLISERSIVGLDLALGVGLGTKFVFKNNFILEANIGIGKTFNDNTFFYGIAARAGISIGKRF